MANNATDPPSAEQKTADRPKGFRRIFGVFLNRRTLMIAIWVVVIIDKVVRILRKWFGDF